MRTLKQIFNDLHNNDEELAHAFIRWMINHYGRRSPEVESVYETEETAHKEKMV